MLICDKYRNEIFEMYSNGVSTQGISNKLPEKISWATIVNYLKRNNIPIKKRGFSKNHESGNRRKNLNGK